MKTILTLATLLSCVVLNESLAIDPPKDAISPIPGREESIKQKAQSLWIKSKGYISEDPRTFNEGAQQTLTDLGREIDKVAAMSDVAVPPYFVTRVQSLRQQHEHLSQKLQELTPEAIKSRTSGPRYAFDQCVASLEKAIDQADDEADLLAKMKTPEKREIK